MFQVGFTEPFTVFGRKGHYYLLARSGKLYSASSKTDEEREITERSLPPQPAQYVWTVKKLWSDESRPIHAVITDTATNASYGFTEAFFDKYGKKHPEVYFKFEDKLDPIQFDRSKLKQFECEKPVNLLRSYTQVLIDAKKIDPKATPKKP